MDKREMLIEVATTKLNPKRWNNFFESGGVASAILTKNGNIYTGVCIQVSSGIGFCAEHAAVSEMINNNENEIEMIVAIGWDKTIYPPCGRCRELVSQLSKNNKNTIVVLPENNDMLLSELLQFDWKDKLW